MNLPPLNPNIAIHGLPRSGTSWLGEIFNSNEDVLYKFQPLFSYALKGFLSPESKDHEIKKFYQRLRSTKDDFLDQLDSRESGKLPKFSKSENPKQVAYKEVRYHHILENLATSNVELKIVLLVRNPMAVINSWLNAPREFRSDLGWIIAEEWREASKKNLGRPEEFNGFDKWIEATRLFVKLANQYPKKVLLSSYENLVSDTENEVARIFEFCNISMTKQTREFIQNSSSVDKASHYSVYRSNQVVDKWKTQLDSQIASTITAELAGTELEVFIK